MKNNNRRIEAIAEKILKGEKIKASSLNKEARKYANRLKKYAKDKGVKSVPRGVREALHYVTPSALKEYGKKTLNANIEKYSAEFGKPTKGDIAALKYMTAKSLAKAKGISPSVKNGGTVAPVRANVAELTDTEYDKTFSEPVLGKVSWYALPMGFRASRNWPHRTGSFMYNNSAYLWVGEQIDLDGLAKNGVDGNDHSLAEFFGVFVAKVRPDIVFLGSGEEIWWTTRQEWESKIEASPDFLRDRRYR